MVIIDKAWPDFAAAVMQDDRFIGELDFNFPRDGGMPFLILDGDTFNADQLRELADFLDAQEPAK